MQANKFRKTAISAILAGIFPLCALAAGGAIEGKVQDSGAKQVLGNLVVKIKETGETATTAADGNFVFRDVAPGVYTLSVQLPGRAVVEQKITVADKQTLHPELQLGQGTTALQQIVIQAQFAPAEMARAAQQEAPNLVNITTSAEMKKLPDVNTGEAVRRLPGVSLEMDEGEGRYVNIRGLDADLNSTTFGGVRLPPTNNASPFGGYRAVTFDSIPIGLVGAIKVTKSNLPEQDAEALGGTIEITPKTAPLNGRPFLQGNIGSGYEDLRGTSIQDISVSGGLRFGGSAPAGSNIVGYSDKPFSFIGTLAYYADKRGIDDVEAGFLDNPALPQNAYSYIEQRYYNLHRRRHGYGVELGYQPSADTSYYLRAFDAGHTEQYSSNKFTLSPDGSPVDIGNGQITDTLTGSTSIVKKLRDEQETIRDRVIVLGGKTKLNDKTLDYHVSSTAGTYDRPYDYNSVFSYSPPGGTNNSSILYSQQGKDSSPRYQILGTAAGDYLNPANYALTSFVNNTAHNFDKETSYVSNLDSPVNWGGFDDESFKVGASIRLRHKQTASPQYSYPNLPSIALNSVITGSNVTYYGGQYQNGPSIASGLLQGQLGSGVQQASDIVSSAAQFLDAKENIYAGYAQYQFTQGSLGIIGGVRYEATRDSFNAFSTSNNGADPVPVSGSRAYSNIFPSLQAKYVLRDNLQLRAAYSSTIARPGFNQINPAFSIDTGAGIASFGNPNLKPATANSFDFSIEQYLENAGVISFGLFDKEIKNYIVPSVSNQNIANTTGLYAGSNGAFRLATYSNSSSSYARGFEFNYEQRFKKLPGIWSGLGAGLNWTRVFSRFEIRPGEYASLPSSSKDTANMTVFYERNGLNMRLAAYYVSRDLFAIQGPGIDVYNSARLSMDFGGTYAIDKNLMVYFNAKNLLNTPHRFEEGSPGRVIQREFYGKTYQIGLNFNY